MAPEDVNAGNEEEYLREIAAGRAPLRPEIDFLPSRAKINVLRPGLRGRTFFGTPGIECICRTANVSGFCGIGGPRTRDLATKAHHVRLHARSPAGRGDGQAALSADSFLVTGPRQCVQGIRSVSCGFIPERSSGLACAYSRP